MAAQSSDTELLTEHFGYPPVSLLDDIINAINMLAEKALKSIEQYLMNQPPNKIGFQNPRSSKSKAANRTEDDHGTASPPNTPEAAARFEIDNGTHQLETLLCSSIDKNFDLFELYVMRNILCVKPEDRDWLRLKHYEGLEFKKDEAGGPSVESVTGLRRRVQASQRLNVLLHAEKARNDALLYKLRNLAGKDGVKQEGEDVKAPFAFLREKGALAEGGADAPIQTTTAFTLSQLQALRSLSSSLRHIAPDLVAAAAAEDDGRKNWRRERTEYVEGSVKKHLENLRGLELGTQGEVRDGEWQGGGRKYSKDEVEELERVAGVLGSKDSDEMDVS